MVRGKKIPKPIKEAIIEALKSGDRVSVVSRRYKLAKQTVSSIKTHFEIRGHLDSLPKTGRPRKTVEHQDRIIRRLSVQDPQRTASNIKAILAEHHDLNVSVRTVGRRLNDFGLIGRHGVKKPLISSKNRKRRLEFARAHLHWTYENWSKVLFSDESKFHLFGSDGIRWVRRPNGQKMNPRYQIPTVKHGGGNIMIWGCFSARGVGPLYRIQGTMNKEMYRDILQKHMLPFAKRHMGRKWIFQQDNDPKHTSKLIKSWFTQTKTRLMEWPSQSPDLNPIEHLWNELKRSVAGHKFSNADHLYQTLVEKWNDITPQTIENLLRSMPKRMQAVIDLKGYATKY